MAVFTGECISVLDKSSDGKSSGVDAVALITVTIKAVMVEEVG